VVYELVRHLADRGLVKDWSDHDDACAVLEVDGAREVQDRRRRRADPQLRAAAARTGGLQWFYRQDLAGEGTTETSHVLTAEESLFMGDRLTAGEIDRAAEYLASKGLIKGVEVAEFRGPAWARITAEGHDCMENNGGNVSDYLRDQSPGSTLITNSIGTLNNSGALAVGSTGVTQNVTVEVDPTAVAGLVKALLAELPKLPLDSHGLATAREALEEVQRQVDCPDPQPERVASAFGRFVSYIMEAGKPVVTAAFMLAARHIGLPPALPPEGWGGLPTSLPRSA
jgi:hypothetical protein